MQYCFYAIEGGSVFVGGYAWPWFGFSLAAVCDNDDVEFLGWYDENGALVSGEDNYTALDSELNLDLTAVLSCGSAMILGDADGDGSVTMAHAVIAAHIAMDLERSVPAADYNGDGVVTIIDAVLIARKAFNLI